MKQPKPGGYVGFIVLLILLVAGLIFNIGWMRTVGVIGILIWLSMFVIGWLAQRDEEEDQAPQLRAFMLQS